MKRFEIIKINNQYKYLERMEYCNGCPISFIQRYHSLFPIKMARKRRRTPLRDIC